MERRVTIAERYCGPSDRGNGGYTAGLLARELGGTVEVTLRAPAPLGRPLALRGEPGGGVVLADGELVIAEAVPIAPLGLVVPDAVSLDAAAAAERRSDRLAPDAEYPRCFSCGPDRAPGDGLRILAGPVAGRDLHAARWSPGPELGDPRGLVDVPILWAALDCTGRAPLVAAASGEDRVRWGASLLGRLAVETLAPVPVGHDLVVTSWLLTVEGRKGRAAVALLDARGAVLATATSTWIAPRAGGG